MKSKYDTLPHPFDTGGGCMMRSRCFAIVGLVTTVLISGCGGENAPPQVGPQGAGLVPGGNQGQRAPFQSAEGTAEGATVQDDRAIAAASEARWTIFCRTI